MANLALVVAIISKSLATNPEGYKKTDRLIGFFIPFNFLLFNQLDVERFLCTLNIQQVQA